MRSKLVVTTATAALVAGTVLAMAQTPQPPAPSGSPMPPQSQPSQPNMQREQGKGTTGQAQPAPNQGMKKGAQQGAGNVTLTTEQRTKIRQSVLQGANAPRAANVNFSLTIGTVVPATVQVVEVSAPLLEIRPEWRGHSYFVVGDEIVIIDRDKKIVAVLAV
jgi:Protein of unknown function (DUF1236)